jgi:hypothetical protein
VDEAQRSEESEALGAGPPAAPAPERPPARPRAPGPGLPRRLARLGRDLWACRRLDDLALAVKPGAQWPWGGPLNGQRGRQDLVRWIGQQISFGHAVETGTWRASSTAFLADTLGCPVWTVETDPGAFRHARRILQGRKDLVVVQDDSRRFLAGFEIPDRAPAFIYLDSHWDPDDLPLWQEITTIFERWPNPVVMIDDFRVPGDAGYRYDCYGAGSCLDLADLEPNLPAGVQVLFPTLPSAQDTGARRGCCVLSRPEEADRLRGPHLRPPGG